MPVRPKPEGSQRLVPIAEYGRQWAARWLRASSRIPTRHRSVDHRRRSSASPLRRFFVPVCGPLLRAGACRRSPHRAESDPYRCRGNEYGRATRPGRVRGGQKASRANPRSILVVPPLLTPGQKTSRPDELFRWENGDRHRPAGRPACHAADASPDAAAGRTDTDNRRRGRRLRRQPQQDRREYGHAAR